jgi:hypothetical protein
MPRRERRQSGFPGAAFDLVPRRFVYLFFGLHMLMFGGSGFLIAYSGATGDPVFLWIHGGIAITVYLVFYLVIFGPGAVGWMLVNAALGAMLTMATIDLILAPFGRRAVDYPLEVHAIPFLYLVLYTFLLRQAVIDLVGARADPGRQWLADAIFVGGTLAVTGLAFLLGR